MATGNSSKESLGDIKTSVYQTSGSGTGVAGSDNSSSPTENTRWLVTAAPNGSDDLYLTNKSKTSREAETCTRFIAYDLEGFDLNGLDAEGYDREGYSYDSGAPKGNSNLITPTITLYVATTTTTIYVSQGSPLLVTGHSQLNTTTTKRKLRTSTKFVPHSTKTLTFDCTFDQIDAGDDQTFRIKTSTRTAALIEGPTSELPLTKTVLATLTVTKKEPVTATPAQDSPPSFNGFLTAADTNAKTQVGFPTAESIVLAGQSSELANLNVTKKVPASDTSPDDEPPSFDPVKTAGGDANSQGKSSVPENQGTGIDTPHPAKPAEDNSDKNSPFAVVGQPQGSQQANPKAIPVERPEAVQTPSAAPFLSVIVSAASSMVASQSEESAKHDNPSNQPSKEDLGSSSGSQAGNPSSSSDEQLQGLGHIIASVINGVIPAPSQKDQEKGRAGDNSGGSNSGGSNSGSSNNGGSNNGGSNNGGSNNGGSNNGGSNNGGSNNGGSNNGGSNNGGSNNGGSNSGGSNSGGSNSGGTNNGGSNSGGSNNGGSNAASNIGSTANSNVESNPGSNPESNAGSNAATPGAVPASGPQATARPIETGAGSMNKDSSAPESNAPGFVPVYNSDGNNLKPQVANAASAPTIMVNGQDFEVKPSQLVAPGSTIAIPNANQGNGWSPSVVINGQEFKINPSQLISPSTTIALPKVESGSRFPLIQQQNAEMMSPPLVVAGQTVSVNAAGAVAVGSQTVMPGSSAILVGGTPVSLGSTGLVVGSSTIRPEKMPEANPVATIAGQMITPAPVGGGYVIAGLTLEQGGPAITVAGTPASLGPSGLIIGSSVIQLAQPSVFSIGGQAITANPSGFVLAAGASQVGKLGSLTPITANGVIISVGPGVAVLNDATINLATPTTTIINGQRISLGPDGIGLASTTIALPGAETLRPVTAGGMTFALGQSVALIDGTSFNLAIPTNKVVNGQTISIGPDGIGLASTTIPVPGPETLRPVTAGGITFSLGISTAVIDETSFNLATPTTKVLNGQTISIGPGGIGLASTTIPILGSETLRPVTAGDITFSLGTSAAVIDGTLFNLAVPTTKVLNGQTISIGPSGVGLASTTIPIPGSETLRPVTAGGITFSLGSSAAMIDGTSFNLAVPTTKVLNGQTISIGPNGVGFASTTVPIRLSPSMPTSITAGGITFGLGPSIAVIDGTTFTINPNSPATIKTLANGQTVSIGPSGIGFATTTVPIPNMLITPTPVTAGGITFSLSPSVAVIDGTTFTINHNSPATTKTLPNGQIISIGPNGIGFPSSTIPLPDARAAQTGLVRSTTIAASLGSAPTLRSTTVVDGLTLALGESIALVGGSTFRIGPGATPTTAIVGGKTVSFGAGGVGFASTTIGAPLATATGGGGGARKNGGGRVDVSIWGRMGMVFGGLWGILIFRQGV